MESLSQSHPSGLDDSLFLNAQRESEALKERLLELYLLYTTSRTCSAALHPGALFENIVALLKNTLKVEEFSLMLEDRESGLFEMWTGDERVLKAAGDCTFRSGEGIAGRVAASGEAILVHDVSRDERFLHYKGMLPGIGSFLSVPLKASDGAVFGVINLHKAEINAFRDQDLSFFQAVANNLAAALERARLYEKARQESIRDELTGIYNRRYFQEYAGREMLKARRHHDSLALVMLDLDHFKLVNDNCGHAVGDQVLTQVAESLRNGIRQSDLVARYGGEEFTIMLPDTDMEDACRLTDKLRKTVAHKLSAASNGDQWQAITFSAGISCFPEDGDTIEELFEAADRRLYLAKNQGRNQVVGSKQDPALALAPNNRRLHPRYRAAIRMIRDAACATGQPIHAIDILLGDQWLLCSLMDISREGFNSLVRFQPQMGASYLCRAIIDPKIGQPRQFAIKVRHVNTLDDQQYLLGAQVSGQDDSRVWHDLYAAIAH